MTRANESGKGNRIRVIVISMIAVVGMVAVGGLGGPFGAAEAATSVDLGTAESFAVLADSTITNTGPTTITGDVGLHPGTAVTGFDSVTLIPPSALHVDDAVAEQAKVDLVTAYNEAAGQPVSAQVSTELGGQVLTGGVYDSADGTFEITGTLTLDAQGPSVSSLVGTGTPRQ